MQQDGSQPLQAVNRDAAVFTGASLDAAVMGKGKAAGSQLPLLDARKGCKKKNSNSWDALGFIQACLPMKGGFMH